MRSLGQTAVNMADTGDEAHHNSDKHDTSKEEEEDYDKKEHEHFMRVVEAFKSYRSHCLRRIQSAEDHYLELPDQHQNYLPRFRENLDVMRTCVAHNHEVIKLMLQEAEVLFENKNLTVVNGSQDPHLKPTLFDTDKVKTTIKQFYRDWSQAGKEERDACYLPVIAAVEKRFPPDTHDTKGVNILVPGAGLGRLAHEFARRGYNCQANEWSLFMLLASNFVLNKCKNTNSLRLYPWVHQWSNNMRSGHQTSHITFPDIDPSDLPEGVNFSMAAGDFLEVYTMPGPLLYHYSDVPGESSIEISYEDLRSVIKKVGFDIEEERDNVRCSYTQNPLSMLHYQYRCVFFVARKPLDAPVS
ncbi:carnosine N-methyltransferase-like isoform X2 [Littorina saxatilis]|uniref:carnosine N-methyltransferase-like isoform X2 n=1 Tax=Littorina saxatilis TaxID=31220 RepID=UPI0038B54303